MSRIRPGVSVPGSSVGSCSASASAALAQRADAHSDPPGRRDRRRASRRPAPPASASSRSMASWRSSIASKPKSARSAMPPTIRRTTGSERPVERRLEDDAVRHRHAPIVPHPTTRSPSIRHAVWPGAAPPTSRSSTSSTRSCAPATAQPQAPGRRGSAGARASTAARGGAAAAARRRPLAWRARARTHHHAVATGVLGQHVERLGRRRRRCPGAGPR